MAIMLVLVVVVGRVLFDVHLQVSGIPTLIVTLVVGAAAFCSLGLALTAIIPSVDAAPAVTNAIALPLYFVSDVFLPPGQAPGWIETIGNIFPIKHLNNALFTSFDPFTDGVEWPWDHWLVIALWGVLGAAVASRKFLWSPWGS